MNRFSLSTRLKRSKLPIKDFNRLHTHSQDVVLCIGGARGGKTIGAVAVVIDTLLRYPGAQAIIGAKTYQDLKDTVLEEWRKRFSVHKSWDHPLVESKPTDHSKILRLVNGSFARFMHFDDFERLRGREASIVHLDEASQMDDARAFQELIRRSSGSRVPIRQFLLTTNPPETDNWLHTTFQLKQYEPGYDGAPIQIGDLCTCQFCQNCLNIEHTEVEWEFTMDQDNPELTIGMCPNCGAVKTNDCVGNQSFFRVIQSSALDNPALPADYMQTQKAGMDEATYRLYALGELIRLREGKVFKSFGRQNTLPFNQEMDLEKPIHWSFDFNISYQCSALFQTMNTVQGIVAQCLDEIVLPESGPEDVAREFMRRYPSYSTIVDPKAPPIYLYGDPAGLNRSTAGNERSKFQIVYDLLTQGGYNVEMVVRKIKGNTQIPILHSVDAVNTMLCNADGVRRLFFNPKCEYTIKSMEGTRYKEKVDPPAIDKQCDDNAARNPDKRTVHMLTHPGDAVRYFVVKVDPILMDPQIDPYVHIPGDGTIRVTQRGNIQERESVIIQDEPRSLKEELEDLGSLMNIFQSGWGW